jgi:ABC-2 type transport system permease protein
LLILIGLPFMLIFSRTEEDSAWKGVPGSLFVTVGIIAALFGLIGVFTDLIKVPDYSLPYGLGLSLLGLLCLGLYIAQRGGDSETGYRIAKWLGYAGLAVLILAGVRSLLPSLVEMSWLQDWFPSLEDVNLSSYLVPNGFLYLVLGAFYLLAGRILASENKCLVMTRRELAAFFVSPIGYIVLGGTVIAAWFVFQEWLFRYLIGGTLRGGFPEPVVAPYFFDWFVILFIMIAIPMLTMRLVSEENRAGTMEVLLTAPVGESSVVLSKFLAAWIFTIFVFVMWLIFPLLLRIAGQESFDFRPMLSSMLGFAAMSFGFVAMGLFFSTLTKNQIVSLLLTFAGILAMFMLYFISQRITADARSETSTPFVEFLRYVNFVDHMLSFSMGKVYLKHLLFHFSFGLFWLFLTLRVLESRKWR